MRRFCRPDNTIKYNGKKNIVISLLLFTGILVVFLTTVSRTAQRSVEEQKQYLEEAVEQSLMQCYVTEGRYPESFSYLEKKYGIIYDKELFRVDYRVYGSNLYPEVKVLVLEE